MKAVVALGSGKAYTDETKGENYFVSFVTYKIPVENLDDFETFVDSKDSLVSKNKTAENISGEYIYNETTIEALEDKLELYNSKLYIIEVSKPDGTTDTNVKELNPSILLE